MFVRRRFESMSSLILLCHIPEIDIIIFEPLAQTWRVNM